MTSYTKEQLEDIFRGLVIQLLGLPEEDKNTVRFLYGTTPETDSAPSFTRQENLVFLNILPQDDPISLQKDFSLEEKDAETLLHIESHTEVYAVRCTCYGPSAFDWAKMIRHGVSKRSSKWYLEEHNIFLVPGVRAPVPAPELVNGQWYQRYDVTLLYNVGESTVLEELPMATDVTVEVQPKPKRKTKGGKHNVTHE